MPKLISLISFIISDTNKACTSGGTSACTLASCAVMYIDAILGSARDNPSLMISVAINGYSHQKEL